MGNTMKPCVGYISTLKHVQFSEDTNSDSSCPEDTPQWLTVKDFDLCALLLFIHIVC